MQKIAIFGGTGMTGQCAVAHALKKGLKTKVLYRDISTVPEEFKEKVVLIKGDVTNFDDVKNFLEDVNLVCIVLGTRNNLGPTAELSTGTKNIIKAMKEIGLRKFSICLSSFLLWDDSKIPPRYLYITAEHRKMLDIAKNSNLDYIAVLPPQILNEPSGEIQILHNASPGRAVSKWDLGKFLIDSLHEPEHYGKLCGIAKK